MKSFTLHLQDTTQYECVENVTSFVGRDQSGAFGILADHGRMMTILMMGLARFQTGEDMWQYLALPGGLLYFVNNQLYLSTRRYVRDVDYSRMSAVLNEQLVSEEAALQSMKDSLRRLEEEMFKRLWKMGRGEYNV